MVNGYSKNPRACASLLNIFIFNIKQPHFHFISGGFLTLRDKYSTTHLMARYPVLSFSIILPNFSFLFQYLALNFIVLKALIRLTLLGYSSLGVELKPTGRLMLVSLSTKSYLLPSLAF
jgi:hypothetical protein